MQVTIHSKGDYEKMRKAGKLAAKTLDFITQYVQVGITTEELNDKCHEFIVSHGAVPAPLNYRGFPKSICTSINHVICHGIPGQQRLKNGDIINIDVTVIVDGWHGDTSRMYYVGDVGIKYKRLVKATYDAMMRGIEQVKPGAYTGDIGYAIESCAREAGYSVVRDYTGHGIGRIFHGEPSILNYGSPRTGVQLKEGMFFTVEPMLNIGKADTILSNIDNWTVTTRDKTWSAQFEHTIGVTDKGFEIFTLSPQNFRLPPYD
ncbi:MAG: type I methionyl aminopeptidase [Rickettsiaceae bacterium]